MRSTKILLLTAAIPAALLAQQHTAADVTSAAIHAALEKTATANTSDQQLRVENIRDDNGGDYNVAIGVIHRAKMAATATPAGLIHHEITEIYHVLEGSATFVTGGTMDNLKESTPDSEMVKVLAGPTASGRPIHNGISRKVGPGDVVIIPAGTPHGFSEITTPEVVYLVVRVDPHKVLPAGYIAK